MIHITSHTSVNDSNWTARQWIYFASFFPSFLMRTSALSLIIAICCHGVCMLRCVVFYGCIAWLLPLGSGSSPPSLQNHLREPELDERKKMDEWMEGFRWIWVSNAHFQPFLNYSPAHVFQFSNKKLLNLPIGSSLSVYLSVCGWQTDSHTHTRTHTKMPKNVF